MTESRILRRGPWQVPYRATNVLCSDGKRRNARITSQPDTFFSIPASVKVRGKTVTGFIMGADNDLRFHANRYGKNAYLLWREFDEPAYRQLADDCVRTPRGFWHARVLACAIGYIAEISDIDGMPYAKLYDNPQDAIAHMCYWLVQARGGF